MKQRISKLLPAAVKAVRAELSPSGEVIEREYQGYISSFGASVMQMGLLPTLAVFAEKKPSGGKKQNPQQLLNILHTVVCSEHSGLDNTIKAALKDPQYNRVVNNKTEHQLFDAAVDLASDERKLRELHTHLLDAAVATKLAIRTFQLTKP